MIRIGVLASHEGTTLQAVLDACTDGAIDAQVAVVVGNNSRSGALVRAKASGIPSVHLSRTTHPCAQELAEAICETLTEHGVELVLLAGYMKKLGGEVLDVFEGRILNTHPGPLPGFGGKGMYGERVHRAVLEAGVSESAACVHVVHSEYDVGPLVAKEPVPVLPGDSASSLAARVQAAERRLLIRVLGDFATRGRFGSESEGSEVAP